MCRRGASHPPIIESGSCEPQKQPDSRYNYRDDFRQRGGRRRELLTIGGEAVF
jgi:hypothetical protein